MYAFTIFESTAKMEKQLVQNILISFIICITHLVVAFPSRKWGLYVEYLLNDFSMHSDYTIRQELSRVVFVAVV